MKESLVAPEQLPPVEARSMGNFHMMLPGGYLRKIKGNGSDKDLAMDKIDELLKDEFPDINPQEIINSRLAYIDQKCTEEEYKESQAKLRRIYDRLIELGYDETMLGR